MQDQETAVVHPIEKLIEEDDSIRVGCFTWLMEHLVAPDQERFKGCALVFPDTAFFSDGRPTHIIKCDRDFCLMKITNP